MLPSTTASFRLLAAWKVSWNGFPCLWNTPIHTVCLRTPGWSRPAQHVFIHVDVDPVCTFINHTMWLRWNGIEFKLVHSFFPGVFNKLVFESNNGDGNAGSFGSARQAKPTVSTPKGCMFWNGLGLNLTRLSFLLSAICTPITQKQKLLTAEVSKVDCLVPVAPDNGREISGNKWTVSSQS